MKMIMQTEASRRVRRGLLPEMDSLESGFRPLTGSGHLMTAVPDQRSSRDQKDTVKKGTPYSGDENEKPGGSKPPDFSIERMARRYLSCSSPVIEREHRGMVQTVQPGTQQH